MMNEFPPKYIEVVRAATGLEVPLMNVTEYLAQLFALGLHEADFPVVQPRHQPRLLERCRPGRWTDYGREICRRATAILRHDFAPPVAWRTRKVSLDVISPRLFLAILPIRQTLKARG